MTIARVIGLGQRAAGDDGVGLTVIDRLHELAPQEVELIEVAEPSALISLLATPLPVVIVDGVVTDRGVPGELVELDAAALTRSPRNTSTHGIGLAEAIALARVLAPTGITRSIWIVGVTIMTPVVSGHVLSAAVEAAVPRAVRSVLHRLGDPATTASR